MSEKIEPDADCLYPAKMPDGSVSKHHVFLKNAVTKANIEVGDYTYYHDFDDPTKFQERGGGYFPEGHDVHLKIGKYCSIAHGATFLSSVTNHHMDGFATYPFAVFWPEEAGYDYYYPQKGDTVIGNGVWIGAEAVIMPGVQIGDGAIVGTRSVVTKDVPPYSIVAGNPAKWVRNLQEDAVIARLLEMRWWDWPHHTILANSRALVKGDMEALEKAYLKL